MGAKRNKLLEMAEDGLLDPLRLCRDLLGWLSEDECGVFADANDLALEDEEDEEDEEYEEDEEEEEE